MKTVCAGLVVLLLGCGELVVPASDAGPTGRWVAVGKPTTGAHRYEQSATVLLDGRVLAAGGETWDLSGAWPGTGSAQTGAELYDPATREWAPTGSLQIARGAHRATRLADGRVLVTGGESVPSSEWTALASCELYDPSTGTWRLTTSMTTSRVNHAQALLADGRVLVAGGTGTMSGTSAVPSSVWLGSIEVFDPVNETWATWAPLLEVEPTADAIMLGDGRVLITGLFHDEIYDPAIGSQPPPPPPAAVFAPRTPYNPQERVDCGVPDGEQVTALNDGSAHILTDQTSFVLQPARPARCRSLLGPATPLTGPASVTLATGLVLFTFDTQDASLLDPQTGVFTPIAPRIYPRGTSHLLLLHDGSVLVTGGDDVASEVLEWK